MTAAIGIIGGSGLHDFEEFDKDQKVDVVTPFGKPSDDITYGRIGSRDVYFLLRHGKGHSILPHELNHRANIYAMRMLNVRWIICLGAVGSLREECRIQDIVVPDQLFDRTSCAEQQTFFGEGIVAHVSFGDPYSAELRRLIINICQEQGKRVHDGGTYVNIDGPAFSTRAESAYYRQLGFDVIGMTNAPEAKLAREAEIALATMAMVTDYDAWRLSEPVVNTSAIQGHLGENKRAAQDVIKAIIPRIPEIPDWPEHRSLDSAFVTPRAFWPTQTIEKLKAILERD